MAADAFFLFRCRVDIDELFAELGPLHPDQERLNLLLEGTRSTQYRASRTITRLRDFDRRVRDVPFEIAPDLRSKLERLGFEVRPTTRKPSPQPAERDLPPAHDIELGDWRLHLCWYMPSDRDAFSGLVDRLTRIAERPLTYFPARQGWTNFEANKNPSSSASKC